MRIPLIVGFVAVALGVGAVHAGAQDANRAALEKQLLANERAVNTAFATNDTKTFTSMVSPEGIGVDGGGVMKVADFMKMMGEVKVESWDMTDGRVTWLSPDVALVTYRWTGKGTFQGMALPSPTYASTIWANKGGKWMAVFHQESVAMPPPK